MRKSTSGLLLTAGLWSALADVPSAPAQARSAPTPHPLIMLEVWGVFLPGGPPHSPNLVLYDDGLVIFQADDRATSRLDLAWVRLAPPEISALLPTSLADSFVGLDSLYDLIPEITDVSVRSIHLWRDGRHKMVAVRGDLDEGPAAFATLFRRLAGFTSARAQRWLPDSIEITLRRIDEQCPEAAPVPWPADLPRPQVTGGDGVYIFYVPTTFLVKLEALLDRHWYSACKPVVFEKTHWMFDYDYPLPAQSAWRSRELP